MWQLNPGLCEWQDRDGIRSPSTYRCIHSNRGENIEDKSEKRERAKKNDSDINPFAALLGLTNKKKKVKPKDKKVILTPEDIKKDNFIEKMLRAEAAKGAAGALYLAYDVYKKAHRMASAPGDGFDTHDAGAIEKLSEGGGVGFKGSFKKKDSNQKGR